MRYIGEIWEIFKLDYDKDNFVSVGEIFVYYEEINEWLKPRNSVHGCEKEWLRRFRETRPDLENEIIVKVVKSYVEYIGFLPKSVLDIWVKMGQGIGRFK